MQRRAKLGLSTALANGDLYVKSQHTRTQSVIVKLKNDEPLNYVILDELSHESCLSDECFKSPVNDTNVNNNNNVTFSLPEQNNEYICNWVNCGRRFENLECLGSHVSQMHATGCLPDGLFYCRWNGCQRTLPFNARYKMLVHMRTHTKEKPHQCSLCYKRFSRAENLKIHCRSHSGEKPYTCTYAGCGKAYSNSSDRFKHTRTHTMEKPYMCKMPGCHKRYTDPSSLRKHVKTTKHSKQYIISTIKSNSLHEQWPENSFKSASNSPYIEHSLLPTMASTNQANSFCISMEKMCNIKSNNFTNYWHNESARAIFYDNHSKCEKTSFAIKLSLNDDSPLDLRVKRS